MPYNEADHILLKMFYKIHMMPRQGRNFRKDEKYYIKHEMECFILYPNTKKSELKGRSTSGFYKPISRYLNIR